MRLSRCGCQYIRRVIGLDCVRVIALALYRLPRCSPGFVLAMTK